MYYNQSFFEEERVSAIQRLRRLRDSNHLKFEGFSKEGDLIDLRCIRLNWEWRTQGEALVLEGDFTHWSQDGKGDIHVYGLRISEHGKILVQKLISQGGMMVRIGESIHVVWRFDVNLPAKPMAESAVFEDTLKAEVPPKPKSFREKLREALDKAYQEYLDEKEDEEEEDY